MKEYKHNEREDKKETKMISQEHYADEGSSHVCTFLKQTEVHKHFGNLLERIICT
jgi:hypothetical protein